ARVAPGQRLPGFNPATGTRFNAVTATPGPHGYPRERLVNPSLAPPGPLRTSTVNAVGVPTNSNAAPLERPPAALAGPPRPSGEAPLRQAGQLPACPPNAQPRVTKLARKTKGPASSDKGAGRACGH